MQWPKRRSLRPAPFTANSEPAFNWLSISPNFIKRRRALFNNSRTATAIFHRDFPNTGVRRLSDDSGPRPLSLRSWR